MINVIQNGTTYEISFRYDPNVVSLIKNVPRRRWVPEEKIWTIPLDSLGFLIAQFQGTQYESALHVVSHENINVNDTLDSTATIPDIDISDVDFKIKPGSKPYQHQLDLMKYALYRQQTNINGFLLADEPGLGKTISSVNLALYNREHLNFKHVLIICCINSSKYNWKRDIKEHTSEDAYILGTRLKRDGNERYEGASLDKLEDLKSMKMYNKSEPLPYFLIMNIEAIRYKSGKTYPILNRLIELVNAEEINMIIIDEIHKNASMTSAQGKCVLELKKKTGTKVEWIPMTGTPIVSKPTDVFLPTRLIEAHDNNSYYMWCKQFCVYGGYGGHEIIGYKNMKYLKNIIQGNMLRRKRDDVLDLPPKLEFTEYIENTEYQQNLYEKIRHNIIEDKEMIIASLNPMTQILKLRQVNGSPELVDPDLDVEDTTYLNKNAKLKRLLELLEEINERNEKVIVYSNWVEPLKTLYKFISEKYKVCCFTGTMSSESREKHKRVFINNPEYKIMLGTIGAMGTSHTFTVARNVIFYDEPWTPADKEQSEDRIYRIGTKDSVNIYTLITQNSVDDKVHQLIYDKKSISDYMIDDNLINLHKNPKLFDVLLGHE